LETAFLTHLSSHLCRKPTQEHHKHKIEAQFKNQLKQNRKGLAARLKQEECVPSKHKALTYNPEPPFKKKKLLRVGV
jgi:hypothetical protein